MREQVWHGRRRGEEGGVNQEGMREEEEDEEREKDEESWQAGWGHASSDCAMRRGTGGRCQRVLGEEERSNNKGLQICTNLLCISIPAKKQLNQPPAYTGRGHC